MADNQIINRTIIETVLQSMEQQCPRSEALSRENHDVKPVDARKLGPEVYKGFPYPIGEEIRRLFTPEHARPDRGRLAQIFKTIERTLQFTAFVMLSQLLESAAGPVQVSAAPLFERLVKPTGLGMGDFAWFIQTAGECFRKSGLAHFMPELAAVLDRDFYEQLNFWTPKRNEVDHHLVNLDAGETERRCIEYGERLAAILSELAFLTRYHLVTMVEIQVEKTRCTPARFHHHIERDSYDEPHREIFCESFSDSHAVLLLKSLEDPPGGFLNLSPLVIDIRHEPLMTREQVEHIKKDLFLFNRRDREGRLRYSGIVVTQQCDLRHLAWYGRLQAEFDQYLRAAGIGAAEGAP